jgi:hypothetical protein
VQLKARLDDHPNRAGRRAINLLDTECDRSPSASLVRPRRARSASSRGEDCGDRLVEDDSYAITQLGCQQLLAACDPRAQLSCVWRRTYR